MTVHTQLSDDGQTLTLQVEGRFDFNVLQAFRKAYESEKPKPQYCLDFSKTDYLDSSALGILLALRDYAGGDNAVIQVIHANDDILKILSITKLDELFQVT